MLFCDDDTCWAPGALTSGVAALEAHAEVAVVTGRIVVEPSGEEDPICIDMPTSPVRTQGAPSPGPCLVSFLAGASVIRRRAFLAAGGFEPRLLIGGEEELLASELLTAGWAIGYLPDAEVHHCPSAGRDPHLRRRQGIRKSWWFTWLRRPWKSALARSATILRSLPPDRVSAAGVVDACRGTPWVLPPAATTGHVRACSAIPPGRQRRTMWHQWCACGSRAQRLLANYLFGTRLIERVEAATDVENFAEQRALEKAGFSKEGVMRHAQFRDGQWRGIVLFSRLRSDRL